MKFFQSRKASFQGTKALPQGTIIIVTKNNQQELRDTMHHLTGHALFREEGGRILIVDHYSFDRTSEVAMEYANRYPHKISFFQKVPEKSVLDLVRPYTSSQYIDIINLDQIERHHAHMPPKKLPGWIERIRRSVGQVQSDGIDIPKLLERIERDRSMVYAVLRNSVLEPLTHLEMQLKSDDTIGGDADSVQAVRKMINKINHVVKHFDPSQFIGDSLFPCITGMVEDFTNRTQINCEVKESGQEMRLQSYFGLSIVRILQEALDNIERHAQATKVEVNIRWSGGKVTLQVKDDGRGFQEGNTSGAGLRFIEERATLLNGSFRMKSKRMQGTMLLLVLPVPKGKGL